MFGPRPRPAIFDPDNDPGPELMSEPSQAHEPMLQFFSYGHLPSELAEISHQFADLAQWIVQELPRNPERTAALRKLLESKDAAVRARLYR
jgi:hypothetical protein